MSHTAFYVHQSGTEAGHLVVLGNLLEDSVVRHLREVGTLDLGSNTVKSSSESILGRGVHHLSSDWSGVWDPGEEDKLGSLTLTTGELVLEVVDSVESVVLWELTEEVVVVGRGGGLLDNDLCLSVVQAVEHELELLTELELVEGLKGLVSDDNTGSGLYLSVSSLVLPITTARPENSPLRVNWHRKRGSM